MPATTPRRLTVFGARLSRSIAYSSCFAAAFSARRARSISFGAASISRRAAFRGGRRRAIRAASLGCPTRSPAKPTRTRKAAPGSGPETPASRRRRSTPTLIRNLWVSATGPSRRRPFRHRARRVHPALRDGADRRGPRRLAARFPVHDLCGRGRRGRLGPGGSGMPDRHSGTGAPDLIFVPRSFLFLQGPQSYFFEHAGRALRARGHRVHRVNLNLGDQLFWRLPATEYRGRFEQWPGFIAGLLEERRVTDLVLLGDRRPYHIAAAGAARERGIAVVVADLGYVRPDWLTLEADGMTTCSRFPRDPAAIRALAENFPEPDLTRRFHTPFWRLAVADVSYHGAAVLGRPLYPHYRRHGLHHPFAEYAAWVWNAPRRLATRRVPHPG